MTTEHRLLPRLVAVDLDGTFLNQDSLVTRANLHAVKELNAMGIEFVVTSGRILPRFPQDVLSLEEMRFAITANGASLIDLQENKELFSDPLPKETAAQVVDAVTSFPIYFEIYVENQAYTDEKALCFYSDSFYSPNRLKAMNQSKNIISDIQELLQRDCRIQKIFLPHVEKEYIRAFEEKLVSIKGVEITNPFPYHYEFTKQGCNKANCLRQLCNRLDILPKDIMAFGDANNDSAMLRFAGMSVAMGNADEEIRKQARFTAKSNAEDGVAQFLQQYVLQ
ncbi:MAG: Cof-type HAD-IIB family hydrolase [Oscillospiraceae bacterium]|jgi:Cof subfamily protein (haloacid dehalogenase superfamily)|nr:Cof-type HAD-IIB family hydrolase [Oscillospiraceae bacterium]